MLYIISQIISAKLVLGELASLAPGYIGSYEVYIVLNGQVESRCSFDLKIEASIENLSIFCGRS